MSNQQKLDPEFKAKWVAALRSGEYKQGIENLYHRGSDTFCCIGVSGKLRGLTLDYMDGQSKMVHISYQEACPLDIEQIRTLAKMNDEGDSFHMIADYIEENL